MRRGLGLVFACAGLLAGCGSALPDPAVVTKLRVLGVRASAPEAAPGAVIHFDALWADPNGHGRPLRKAWAICDPGSGGVGTCGDPARVAVLGTNDTADWTAPADYLDGLSAVDQQIGRDVYVVFGVEVDDGSDDPDLTRLEHDVAFKRVRISTSLAPNRNPSIQALLVNGKSSPSAIDEDASTMAPLFAAASGDSRQKWTSPDGNASGVEDARFSWLITAGSLTDDITYAESGADSVSNRWRLPSGTQTLTLWVVLRDGRGGIDWRVQQVTLH